MFFLRHHTNIPWNYRHIFAQKKLSQIWNMFFCGTTQIYLEIIATYLRIFFGLTDTVTKVKMNPPQKSQRYTSRRNGVPHPWYMRQWTGSALVQIMACRLFGAKPLSQPMLGYCQLGTNLSEILIQSFSFTKMHIYASIVCEMATVLSRVGDELIFQFYKHKCLYHESQCFKTWDQIKSMKK